VWTKYSGCLGGASPFNTLNHFNSLVPYTTTAVTHMDGTSAILAARAKFKAYNVDLGVAFAERNATARGVGDTARRLALAAREQKHGNFRNAARRLGILTNPGRPRGSNWTNHWLELQYGWKPLLSDIYGSCQALSKRDMSDWRVTAKAYRSAKTPYKAGDSSWTGSAERKQGVFVRIDAIPNNDLIMSLSNLGVLNPLTMIWEVLPWSFVVDWFIPIGNWLDTLDTFLGYSQVNQSVTYYTKTKYKGNGLSYASGGFQNNQDWEESGEFFKLTRTGSLNPSVPKFPRFKDPRSLGHMANGLALLASTFSR